MTVNPLKVYREARRFGPHAEFAVAPGSVAAFYARVPGPDAEDATDAYRPQASPPTAVDDRRRERQLGAG